MEPEPKSPILMNTNDSSSVIAANAICDIRIANITSTESKKSIVNPIHCNNFFLRCMHDDTSLQLAKSRSCRLLRLCNPTSVSCILIPSFLWRREESLSIQIISSNHSISNTLNIQSFILITCLTIGPQ